MINTLDRWTRTAALALLWAVLAGAGLAARAEPVPIRVDSGVLIGQGEAGYMVFRGAPYAAAPVGKLRWAPPRLSAAWTTPREARTFSPVCPQRLNADGTPNAGGATGPASEDCLFLNVWAPRPAATSGEKAPVMVWLHGGGNTAGAGSLGAYDGAAFARDGIILVTLNYRLGALGFFAHPAITKAAGPKEPLINYGILDQIAALKWVRRNIAAFGGDPDNVTLFGESAGGQDILTLMTAPAADGLFARAIVQSGGGWSPPAPLAKREAEGVALAAKAGAPEKATLAQLRALPAEAFTNLPPYEAGPGVDGRLLTRSIAQAFAEDHFAHTPLLIGSNSFEASLLDGLKVPPVAILGMANPEIQATYADVPGDLGKARAMFTDSVMGAPARWIAGKARRNPSWLYHFAYVAEARRASTPGAGHASEIPFVFDSWGSLGALGKGVSPTAADLAVTAQVHGCWVAFARSGVPDCPGAPGWPPYTDRYDTLMNFDRNAILVTHFRVLQYSAQQAAALPRLELAPAPPTTPTPPMPSSD